MKKIFISCALVASAAAFAQSTGKVGINTTTASQPQATLDIRPTATNLAGTTNEGILIPRLTAARTAATAAPVTGTLVYVTDAPASASFSDTTPGFYYWNGTIWTKMGSGGGAGGGDTSLYTNDGTLTSNRIVTEGANNLTFNGTGRTTVNSTFATGGAVYGKTRVHTAAALTPTDWAADDYNLVITTAIASTTQISLPDATAMPGRIVSLTNQAGSGRTFVATTANRPQNTSTIGAGKGTLYISDGTTWQILGGY